MRSRGFSLIEAAIALGAAAAFVVAIGGVIHMWNTHTTEITTRADKAGYDRAMKEVSERDNKELADARLKIIALTTKVRDLEQKLAGAQNRIAALLEEKRKRSKADEDAALHSLDDVGHVLRDGIIQPTACPQQGGADPGSAGPGASGEPPQKTCYRFSGASEEFLLDLAREARDNADLAISIGEAYDEAARTVNGWTP